MPVVEIRLCPGTTVSKYFLADKRLDNCAGITNGGRGIQEPWLNIRSHDALCQADIKKQGLEPVRIALCT